MIELPTNFITDITSNANTQIANFSPLLVFIMGLLLALIAIGAILSFLRK